MTTGGEGTDDASPSERLVQTLTAFRALPEYDEESTWLRLTETLLRFCRRNRPVASAWDGLPPGLVESVLAGIEAGVAAVLDVGPSSRFPAEGQLDALIEIAQRELAQAEVGDATLHAAVVARGLAGGVDAVHGDHFIDWFRSEIEHTIEPDSAYPTPVHDPRRFMRAQQANSRPDRAPSRALDVVPYLRLADAATGAYRFVLDFDMYFHLAPLADGDGGLGLAAAQPNLSIAEFDVERTEEPLKAFRNRGAKDPKRQADLVIAAVQGAAEAGASVVVVPEYCLTGEQRERVAAAIDVMSPRPSLVVGGTCEVPDPQAGGNRNEAWIYVPDDPELSYGREIELPAAEAPEVVGGAAGGVDGLGEPGDTARRRRSPVRAAAKVYPAEVGGYVEAVVSAPDVPVFCTESVTFAVLICRDAMSNELVDTLADIGVNLLLVPAFSPKTGTIIGNAVTLATRSQAFVVVACAPACWSEEPGDGHAVRDGSDRTEAAFDGPYDRQPGARLCPTAAAPVSGRGAWVFQAASRSVRWAPIQIVDNICKRVEYEAMTSTESANHLGKVLRSLAVKVQDARAGGKEARLGVAVGVISDLGQFMTTATPSEVRTIQAKVAAVREKLRYGDAVTNRPAAILDDYKNNQMFLSGALWAADEFLEAQLQATKTLAGTKTSQRGALRDVIVERVRNTGTATPKDFIDEARRRGLQIRPDQVSRALGDLMREGSVVPTDAPDDGDRRNRYFKLAELVKPSARKPSTTRTASRDTN